jgi:hypothetical protein
MKPSSFGYSTSDKLNERPLANLRKQTSPHILSRFWHLTICSTDAGRSPEQCAWTLPASDFLVAVLGVACLGLEVALGRLQLVLELVELWRRKALAAENLRLEPVWKDGSDLSYRISNAVSAKIVYLKEPYLVVHMPGRWYAEDVVEFWFVS